MDEHEQALVFNIKQLEARRVRFTDALEIMELAIPRCREWRTRYASSSRIFGNPEENYIAIAENTAKSPKNTLGSCERDSCTKLNVLQQGIPNFQSRDSNETGKEKRPRRSRRQNQLWRYSPNPVDGKLEDDDSASSGYLDSTSETESEHSDEQPHTSDREFLVESDSGLDENASFLGCVGCGEDELCACSATESSSSKSSGRPTKIRRGNPYGDNIRRHIHMSSSEGESDPHHRSGSTPEYSLPVYDSNDTLQYQEDIHNEHRARRMHELNRPCDKKEGEGYAFYECDKCWLERTESRFIINLP